MSTQDAVNQVPEYLERLRPVKARLEARHEALSAEIRQELLAADDERYEQLAQSMVERMEGIDRRVADRFRGLELAAIDRHVEELTELEVALERIEDGRYGQCAVCGEAISPQRLEVQPAAIRCIECQARREAASRPG
ncbi:MAG: TraR/DksA family transcriptional regulator [Gammaproteobacteria bacterium]